MPFEIAEIARQLEQVDVSLASLGSWLEESWRQSTIFNAALGAFHSERTGAPLKSRVGEYYDFYHDLILRHVPGKRIALRWYEPEKGLVSLSYAELHTQASRRAAAWTSQGAKADATICLIEPIGVELLVSLAAAWRLGLVVSLLPPYGRMFLRERLGRLAPDHIATRPRYLSLLGTHQAIVLSDAGLAAPPGRESSHTYGPGEPFARLFSPLVDPPEQPVPLLVDTAYTGALRDALLLHRLRPGEQLAAPGFDPLQVLPALLMSTLLAGAAYLHLDLDDLAADPGLLRQAELRVLGVSTALRDLLMRQSPSSAVAEGQTQRWACWMRNPEEPLDWDAWNRFIEMHRLATVPTANILIDSAAGGAVLFSPPRRGPLHLEVLPVPGRDWALLDVNGSGQSALGDAGLFASPPEDKDRPPYIALARVGRGYRYAGPVTPRHSGRAFPGTEVLAAVRELPFVESAAIVPIALSNGGQQYLFVLLVFTGAEEPAITAREAGARSDAILRHLTLRLSAEHTPGRIEFFPLCARRAKDVIDESWCTTQFLTGALHRKAQMRSYRLLTSLRQTTRAPEEG